jgi:hypothetical protein
MIKWNKNKTKINLVIDSIVLLVLVTIAGLGFLHPFFINGYATLVIQIGSGNLYPVNS